MDSSLSCLKFFRIVLIFWCSLASLSLASAHRRHEYDKHPLSMINIYKTTFELRDSVYINANPFILGLQGEDIAWVNVDLVNPDPSEDDWVAVFSPTIFNSSTCSPENEEIQSPYLCSSPIKYKYANYSDSNYTATGRTSLNFQLINQRADFSFALFQAPKLVAVSNSISFAYPKAPLYPRLAHGKSWNEMTVTWTSGYSIDEAVPFVEWGLKGETSMRSPAGTLTIEQNSMCGAPARTVGWRDPGFTHTSFLTNLWPNTVYSYRMGHNLSNGSYVWSKTYSFKSSPYPGQDSLQRVIIFGDMGKGERDGSNEYSSNDPGALNTTDQLIKDLPNYDRGERDGSNEYSSNDPGALNTTDQLIKDLPNYDIVFHIGDIAYADGYIADWDQFLQQVEPIESTVPYMVASGNHERTWPDSSSFYTGTDSGGECGVIAETLHYVPAENRAKFWYSTDYGMFHFCIADTEHDWREGSEQYKFIEKCLASVDRRKQPWLIFASHRPLGYSSNDWFGQEGSFSEPMGREDMQKLWQKYRVDIAFYGHVHDYERTCPIYQNVCVNSEASHYSGTMNGTIHVVVGGGGHHLGTSFKGIPNWSLYRDFDFGFVKLTAFNRSSLLFDYKKSSDGKVYDSFTIYREYKDVLACVYDSCGPTTWAS